jgi:DNA-binding transcriptional regulator YdaS (Cro superfamily)
MPAHDLLRAWFVRSRTKVTAFADAAGVSRQTVHSWLNGSTPKPAHMDKIGELTGGDVPREAWFVIGWEQTAEGRRCKALAAQTT